MDKNLKAMSGIFATILFLIIAITAVLAFKTWHHSYLSGVLSNVETEGQDSIDTTGISNVIFSDLYFMNGLRKNITINSIKYGGYDCNVNTMVVPGVNIISITDCYNNLTKPTNDIVVHTNNAVYSKKIYDANAGQNTSSNTESSAINGLEIAFSSSTSCDIGENKIIGYFETNNSHIETYNVNSYSKSLCLSHETYTFSTSCSGVYDRMFFLTNITDAHLFLDNSSAEPSNYNWTEVCIEAVGGATSLDITYNTSDMTALNYSCIGSYDPTNVNLYGTMYGECSQNTNKIWLKVE